MHRRRPFQPFRRSLPALWLLLAAAGCGAAPQPGALDLATCTGAGCACSGDGECGAGLRCDTARRRCVACLVDGDCPEGAVCGPARTCLAGCSAGHGCGDAGRCELDAGACVECIAHGDCADPRPLCDLLRNRCAVCLPPSLAGPGGDRCGPATYCAEQAGDYACVAGCKDDLDCAAVDGGVPRLRCDLAAHACVDCLLDDDCPAGAVCAGGRCAPGCTPAHACPASLSCCSGQCADLASDYQHCGACDTACPGGWNCCDAACSNPTDDVQNCGGCGNRCRPANGLPTCVARACQIGACAPGWGDCNGLYGDGCETHIDDEINHCGGCNHTCSVPHATPRCLAGTCQVDTCIPPYSDCNGDPSDGCEVATLGNDTGNCGACGTVCNLPHSLPLCIQGACQPFCEAGWADCDGSTNSGCEVNVTTSLAHCGACRSPCVTPHATPQCTMGQCRISSCDAGYTDCDGDPKTGCEVYTDGDVLHCRACPRACSNRNGTPSCMGGTCTITCNSGYGDCNANVTDGCETDLTATVGSCGACGRACSTINGAASCVNSTCLCGCSAGFANCDNSCTNGCEVDLNSDPRNCGQCGQICNLPHATAACVAGRCVIAACLGSYTDCNRDPVDGCEANLASDPANCGGCGLACTSPNGAVTCLNSVCICGGCNQGFANCDGVCANGCEVNLPSDTRNCGLCGLACSTDHITASCAGGLCNGVCAAGFEDCNGNKQVDGCETDLQNDASHCGTCTTVCSTSHIAGPACVGGACAGACAAGFDDCNNDKQRDGCEADLASSANCGACGNACAAGAMCVGGACTVPCSVKVNEVMTGTTNSASEEFVELYNSCSSTVDVQGWKVIYRSAGNNSNGGDTTLFTIPAGTLLPAGGYLLYAGANYLGPKDGVLVNSMAAAGGAVGLRDAGGTLIDSVSYDTLMVPNNLTETAPAPHPPTVASPGASIGRVSDGSDTNDNSRDFRISTMITPKAANQ